MNEIKILYLAQKYTGKESQAFLIAQSCWYKLTMLTGLHIYSPIMDSHSAYSYIVVNGYPKPSHDFWLKRDLAFLEAFKSQGLGMVFLKDTYHRTFSEDTYSRIIEWDSKGAVIENDWAKKNNVRCVTFESIIERPEEQNKWVDI